MPNEPQTYHVLYRPAGEWQRYELTAVDIDVAVREAERLTPKGYELARVDALVSSQHCEVSHRSMKASPRSFRTSASSSVRK